MPNTDAPHGFDAHAPIYELFEYTQDVGDGTAIFIGDVVDMEDDGSISPADAGSLNIVGVSNSHSAASTRATVRVFAGVGQKYSVQGDSGTAGAATTGANYYGSKNDHIVTHAGNANTKISGMELDVANQPGVGGFSVLGLFPQVGNASGETHSEYFVVCNEHLLNKEDGSGI